MRVRALLFVMLSLLSALPARAVVVNILVNGTVQFGLDNLGLFGGAGQNLRSQNYTMDFAYDIADAIDAGNTRQANGGTLFQKPSPLVRASISINGATVSVAEAYSATYARFLYPKSSILEFGTNGLNGVNSALFSWNRTDQSIDLALDADTNRIFDATDTVYSSFQRGNVSNTVFTSLMLQAKTITVSPASSAVPEPAAWATMIVGFMVVGGALRAQRRIATPAAFKLG